MNLLLAWIRRRGWKREESIPPELCRAESRLAALEARNRMLEHQRELMLRHGHVRSGPDQVS